MIFKRLSKHLLRLAILTNFPFIPCFGTTNLSEEYSDVYHISENHRYSPLKTRNNKDEIEIILRLEDESEKPKYKGTCCSCESLFYFVQSVFQSLSQNNQVEHRYKRPKSPLEALPNEMIYEITTCLDPLSIIKLSHVSKRFRKFLNNDFWVKYNYHHNYQTFNEESTYLLVLSSTEEAPSVKVMLANYYYEVGIKVNKRGLIKKSSLLGLPKAQRYLNEEASKSSYGYSSYSNNYNYYVSYPIHNRNFIDKWRLQRNF
jgi:F-box domain